MRTPITERPAIRAYERSVVTTAPYPRRPRHGTSTGAAASRRPAPAPPPPPRPPPRPPARARSQTSAGVIPGGGAIPLGIGGDHAVTLAERRAAAAGHGPLGLVHLDAHHDVWDSYFGRPYNHGTVFKRACEEGLLDPPRCV